jgi:hypothetical protein
MEAGARASGGGCLMCFDHRQSLKHQKSQKPSEKNEEAEKRRLTRRQTDVKRAKPDKHN